MRSALFWDITRRRVVNLWGRFETIFGTIFQGPISCPEISVRDYHSTLHNIPEEHRCQWKTCSQADVFSGVLSPVTADVCHIKLLYQMCWRQLITEFMPLGPIISLFKSVRHWALPCIASQQHATESYPARVQTAVTVWQIPDAVDAGVCAPDDGWKYHPKRVE
jgi:hypothetical protein